MIDSGTLLGNPRLRILDVDKVTVLKTLHLPLPDKEGGIVLADTPAKGIKTNLLNGAIRYIHGGVRHNVTLTYSLYDPSFLSRQTGKAIGTNDNQIPELTDLYDLICAYNTGRLSISPCTNKEIWYRSAVTSDLNRQTVYPAGFGSVSISFEGLDLFSNSSSTSPIG